MKTFWVRLFVDYDLDLKWIDHWGTGQTPNDQRVICFAIRSKRESSVYRLLSQKLPTETYLVSFVEERPWKKFGDFAGPGTRFPMNEKYLGDEIDSVGIVRARLKAA